MKNLAKNIAIILACLAVLFTGCNNDVGGTIGSNALLAAFVNQNNDSNKNAAANITQLNVTATSDDGLVTFPVKGEESRTILPGALDATKLTFYLWGSDQINTSANATLNIPQVVQFNANASDPSTGTVPVNLSISSYKLKLAAVFTDKIAGLSLGNPLTAADAAKILKASVVYGVADVDLRYNQDVKFYLSPSNLDGTGSVDIILKTLNGWSRPGYSVKVRIEDKADGSVIKNLDATPVSSAHTLYTNAAPAWNEPAATGSVIGTVNTSFTDNTTDLDKGIEYKLSNIKAGSYNFVVEFASRDDADAKYYYYSDTLMVLTNQVSNKTSHSKGQILYIPEVIDLPANPPANLRVGYNLPDDYQTDYYLATFEWDDKSANEEYFKLDLLDVTDARATTATAYGFTDEVNTALKALSLTASINATAVSDVPAEWTTLEGTANVKALSYRETIYQDFKDIYAAGSLNKNSTSISLWLPLGRAYVARLTAVNSATAQNSYVYSTAYAMDSSVFTAPAVFHTVVVNTNAADGGDGTSYTPQHWTTALDFTDADAKKNAPIAINQYRITYNLSGGKFCQVDENGNPTTDPFALVTDAAIISAGLVKAANYDKVVNYGFITENGTALLDPLIWKYDASTPKYATVYNGSTKAALTFKRWLKNAKDGDKYVEYAWETKTTESDVTKDVYVKSNDYGIINIKGSKKYVATPASYDGTYSDNGILYENKVFKISAFPTASTYQDYEGLDLYADFGSDSGTVSIDNKAQHKLYSQNVRAYKFKNGAASPIHAYSTATAENAGDYTTNATPWTKLFSYQEGATAYTDGEVLPGANKISTYWDKIAFVVVENQLGTADKDIYKKVVCDIKAVQGGVAQATAVAVSETFTVGNGTTGTKKDLAFGDETAADAGASYSDPLSCIGGAGNGIGIHNAYSMTFNTSDLVPGSYIAYIKAFTDENEKNPYMYEVTFTLGEPEYADADYESVTTGTSGVYYIKQNGIYKVWQSGDPTTPEAILTALGKAAGTADVVFQLKTSALPKF